jgi:uncharacterized protein YprB with RNaseH-like and TPR domain
MIKKSFVFLERVSAKTEKNIWSQGIRSWEDFMNAESVAGFSPKRKHYYSRQLSEAENFLNNREASYFASRFPRSEMWRLYSTFKQDALFLDIETTGFYGDITVIGLSDGNSFKSLVRGFNLDRDNLAQAFDDKKLLITFNGASFDVPVIKRFFNEAVPDIPHLDLRFPLAKLGYTGGLKNIEKTLGIKRDDSVEGVSGADAVLLWNQYKRHNDEQALNTLIKYNEEDVMNMRQLAELVFDGMSKNLKTYLELSSYLFA